MRPDSFMGRRPPSMGIEFPFVPSTDRLESCRNTVVGVLRALRSASPAGTQRHSSRIVQGEGQSTEHQCPANRQTHLPQHYRQSFKRRGTNPAARTCALRHDPRIYKKWSRSKCMQKGVCLRLVCDMPCSVPSHASFISLMPPTHTPRL